MLFNSYAFILGFLPVVFFGFYLLGRFRPALAPLWLAAASLFFYGWWDVRFVSLLLGSIAFNYGAASLIARRAAGLSKLWLALAITANLALLGYYKYAHFFAENLQRFSGITLSLGEVFLPLGISFFTFTQIAFLVDTFQGKAKESNFVHYTLFVTYFPHLIAGPILHHKEMMPQFASAGLCRLNRSHVAAGLGIFILGLVKKLWIADSLAQIANPVFNAVAASGQPMLFEAWAGALAYTLQLYFDFSGYSDMAVGLSLMFNVRLPMNFDSPYQSTSIIDFWRRWHMTLSRYLRDYLYIPLGGSRRGQVRRYGNLLATMLLGGLWHGAGWTFVIWGGLHGLFLVVNHGWRAWKKRMGWRDGGWLARLGSGGLTFAAVVAGWVFFRAANVATAVAMLRGMAGRNGVATGKWMRLAPLEASQVALVIGLGLAIAWGLPNVRQLFLAQRPTCEDMEEEPGDDAAPVLPRWLRWFEWRDSALHGAVYGLLFFALILYMASAVKSEFLYFQF